MKTSRSAVSLANALKAALLVLAFAAAARWLGFTPDETITFLGLALMLAGITHAAFTHRP